MRDYKRYYWVTAWAGVGSAAFEHLKKSTAKIRRIVVGTHFYQTHPNFIAEFLKSDRVRFVSRTDDLFHPKVYLFEDGPEKWQLLIGSANFTTAAFTANTEAAVLLGPADGQADAAYADAMALIERSWKSAKAMDAKQLEKYKLVWESQRPKLRSLGGRYGKKPGKPIHESAVVTMTWPRFLERVTTADGADVPSRLKVLDAAGACFQRLAKDGKHFNDLDDTERRAIAGTLHRKQGNAVYGVDMNWFGSMIGNGIYRNRILERDPEISRALDAIPLTGPVSESHYARFIDEFEKVPRGRLACATRLLAMKRPDYFVCLDARNRATLCKDFGITAHDFSFQKYWDDIIGRIVESAWWKAPPPGDVLAQRIWKGRAAFLDAIYYED